MGVLTFRRVSNNVTSSVKHNLRPLRIYVQEDVRHHDDIRTLVHFVCPMLAAGSPGPDRLSLHLAANAPVPHSGHRCGPVSYTHLDVYKRQLVDLSPFGLNNDNEVFLPTDEPHGLIEATLTKS